MQAIRCAVLAFAACAVLMTAGPPAAGAGDSPDTRAGATVYDFSARLNDSTEMPLAHYKGKVLLIVNTASHCGFTPQYEGLEVLYRRYHERGFEILAFPANNFLHQEPGSDAEIRTFCSTRFGTTFPLFAKISVKGHDIHPLYAWLTHDSGFPGNIGWNFNKFLVGLDGRVVARFDSKVTPLSEELTDPIDRLLATK